LFDLAKTALKRALQPASKRNSMPKIGETAPAFDALAHDGTRVRSAELAGARYVLWFYPKADTPG
jgi:peroxiredoxin